jgi:hypothetical protein
LTDVAGPLARVGGPRHFQEEKMKLRLITLLVLLRFTAAKIGVAAAGLAEWLPLLGKARPTYTKIAAIGDTAGAVVIGIVDIGNLRALAK